MSWGNKIGIAAMAGFIVYLITVNRLGVYLGILTGAAAPTTGSGQASNNVVPFPGSTQQQAG